MVSTLFWIIIVIIVFDYLHGELMDYLNYSRMRETVPDELSGIYNPEEYAKSQKYSKIRIKFSFLTSTFSLVLILLMLFGSGFSILDVFVRSVTDSGYLQALLFFGILGLGMDLLSLPFQIYSTFVIEERFGFNKTTPVTFVTDKIKSWLLSAVIGAGLLMFIMWAWIETGEYFWIIVLTGLSLFMVFMAMFYTSLIVPLFNKQTPLEESDLKTAITDFSQKAGFRIDNIFVIDGSKRSTKANAYFSGFGPKKRIVLYDTLINDLSEKEIVAVLAHEIGHNKLKHIYIGLTMSVIQSGLMLWLLFVALDRPELSQALGADQPSFYMGILAFGILFSPVSSIIGIFSNMISRAHEYQADNYARSFGYGKQLISGLIKLSVTNLSNLTPHPYYVFMTYSHPTLIQRKKAIEK